MNKKTKKNESVNQTNLPEPTGLATEATLSVDQPNPALKVRREHKDTIFRMLFKKKKNLLSLYNALNETAYTSTKGLKVTTLENAVYMNYKNDVSFIFDYELMLYEHQSTNNPNMPLRNLIYVTTVLKGLINKDELYSKFIQLPAPRFVVFYNGEGNKSDKEVLKLSDAYQKHQEQPELELIVTVYNINYGHNPQLLEACRLLKEYSQFVSIVRDYTKDCREKAATKEAIEKAIDHCIGNNILRDFLLKSKTEATDMCLYEFDEEKYLESKQDEAYKTGLEQGIEQGRKQGLEQGIKQGEDLLSALIQRLIADGRIKDIELAVSDENARMRYYKEYHLI